MRIATFLAALTAVLLTALAPPVLAQDLNAGVSWNGWTDRGNALDPGNYAYGAGRIEVRLDGGPTYYAVKGEFAGFDGAVVDFVDWNGTDNLACTGAGAAFTGQTVLIARGSCTFSQKVANAKAAGAAGVVIYSTGDPTAMARTDGYDDDLPAVMISKADGDALEILLAGGASIETEITGSVFNPAAPNYKVYTTRFVATGLETVPPGVQGNPTVNWSAGDEIVGVSLLNLQGAVDDKSTAFFKFDWENDSYYPSTALGAENGGTGGGSLADYGDFTMQVNGDWSVLGRVSINTVYNDPRGSAFLCQDRPAWTTAWQTPDGSVMQVFLNVSNASCSDDGDPSGRINGTVDLDLGDPFTLAMWRNNVEAVFLVAADNDGDGIADYRDGDVGNDGRLDIKQRGVDILLSAAPSCPMPASARVGAAAQLLGQSMHRPFWTFPSDYEVDAELGRKVFDFEFRGFAMLDEAEEILGSVPAEACRQAIDEAQLLMIEADREIVVRTIGRAETACTTGGCLDDLADAIALFEIADDWRIGGDLVHAINKYGDAWEAANRAILGATKNLDNAPAGVEGTGTLDGATATSLEALGLPGDYVLAPNFPNPFNPSTSIRVGLPEASRVTLNVYDALGREVARLADGHLGAGFHEFRFEAGSLPSGVYIYRLATPAKALTGRMTLLK